MSDVRALPWNAEVDETRCMALWREDLPCPNQALWRVQNSTNPGYSLMCEIHKEGFATDYPVAMVYYISLQETPTHTEDAP